MLNKHFMVDIETTGVNPSTDSILQIAMVEMDFDSKLRSWIPRNNWQFTQGSDKQPEGEFALKYMKDLYNKCNELPVVPPHLVRKSILAFFQQCGVETPKVYFCGLNAATFDLNFLTQHGYLVKTSRSVVDGKEQLTGDFHYRVFDLSGALSLAQSLLQQPQRNALMERCVEMGEHVTLPDGLKEHDALFDCYRQIKMLNGMIRLIELGPQ